MVGDVGQPSGTAERDSAMNAALNLSDRDIVDRIRAGDEELFGRCFHAYWTPLCRVVLYIVHDTDEARDIVAKVFAALWERRARLTITTTFEAYLFGAVRNEARHARRDVARRDDLLSTHVRDDREDASLQGRRLVDGGGAADTTDLELTFDQAVRALPDRYQLAIHLRWHRGMEYAELGEVLGITPDAARMIVTRALGMLRRHLREL